MRSRRQFYDTWNLTRQCKITTLQRFTHEVHCFFNLFKVSGYPRFLGNNSVSQWNIQIHIFQQWKGMMYRKLTYRVEVILITQIFYLSLSKSTVTLKIWPHLRSWTLYSVRINCTYMYNIYVSESNHFDPDRMLQNKKKGPPVKWEVLLSDWLIKLFETKKNVYKTYSFTRAA